MHLSTFQIIGLVMLSIGIAIWVLKKIVPILFKPFFVQIPEVHGAVVISKISGRTKRKPLKEGLHIILPWQYARTVSLEKSAPKEIAIDSVPTKDGATMSFNASYQYRPCLNHLKKFIENDASIINKGIEDMIKSFIGQFAATHTANQIMKKWSELEEFVRNKFKEKYEVINEKNESISYSELEDKYGVEIIRLSLTDVDLPKEIQEQREKALKEKYAQKGDEERWKNRLKMIKRIQEICPTISEQDALNAVQAENGVVQKKVFEIKSGITEILSQLIKSVIKNTNSQEEKLK